MNENSVETTSYGISSGNRASVSPVSNKIVKMYRKEETATQSGVKIESDTIEFSQKARELANTPVGEEASNEFHRTLSITGNKQVVVKLIDPETKDVVRQIPPEDLLRLREAIRDAAEALVV